MYCSRESVSDLSATNGFLRHIELDNTDVPQTNVQPLSSDIDSCYIVDENNIEATVSNSTIYFH